MADADFATFAAQPDAENLPRCSECGALLRPHVLWFDEHYTGHNDYQIERVIRAQDAADVTLFVGTSFSVGITDMALTTALRRGQAIFSIDPVSPPPHAAIGWIQAPSEQALPSLVAALQET
jgi:NAD-dependent deacetylase